MQHTSINPDQKLMTIVGDNLDGLLVDPQNGKVHSSCLFVIYWNFLLSPFKFLDDLLIFHAFAFE